MRYRFGEFELDVRAYELRRNGEPVRLARQPMDLLLLLLDRPHELVSRENIAQRLWGPDIHIDVDAGIHTAVLRIRQVLGDARGSPRFVDTVPGRGYRFVAPVHVVHEASTPRRHNLPGELTSFVGRRRELRLLPAMLASSRLLSLTGAGGIGKTRLAVRFARELSENFRDGAWLVDLAPLQVPELVPQTIATALGFREGRQRSAREVLIDSLRDRELLLILDTCEHLVGACAEIVLELLNEAPALRIIVTSREALGVTGEVVYRVPSLSLPQPATSVTSGDAIGDFEATQLFLERARDLDPAFTWTREGADAIVRLCQRLDGIPLAIELAAARSVVLSPEQIEERLQDRFRLLTGGARTAVARQRTLEATVDWSYQLLSAAERELLCRLAVFPATWTLEAAEQICSGDGLNAADILDLLTRVVDKSLVVAEAVAGARRYRLLDTIRHYARERLAQTGTGHRLSDKHFDFFYGEFRGALPVLRHHDQLPCLRRLRVEQENVRPALGWALSSPERSGKGIELCGALFWFWTKRGLFEEGRLWLERAAAMKSDAPALIRARVLIGLAHMHHFQGRPFDEVIGEAESIGRLERDAWTISFAVFMQALAALERNDRDRAVALALEAEIAGRTCKDPVQAAGPLMVLANVAVQNGDLERARQLYDEAIELERHDGECWGLSIVLAAAAGLSIVRKHFGEARAQASEVLALSRELEDPRGIAWSFEVFAASLAAEGHAAHAAQLWGASDRLLETVGGLLSSEIKWIRSRYVNVVKDALGTETFARSWNDGRTMALENAIAFAGESPQAAC